MADSLLRKELMRKSSPATIKDLAKALNLSVSTVSYALNDGPRSISSEVRDRVLSAAREMGYRPNSIARSLITRRSRTIAVVPHDGMDRFFESPYYGALLTGLAREAEQCSHDLLILTHKESENEESAFHAIVGGKSDGVLFLTPQSDSLVNQVVDAGFPCITITSAVQTRAINYTVDNATGVDQALEYLYKLGHRRISHVAGLPSQQDGAERMDLYMEFMSRKGLSVPRGYIAATDFTTDTGYQAAYRLLCIEPRPTAVLAANDQVAIGIIMAARELGIRIPQDLSVVGFDDVLVATLISPRLTTIRQPIREMATQVVKTLLKKMEGEVVEDHVQFSTELIVRQSTAAPSS
jgi:DNA-binding LacI/PurR family transcriptional regulator